MNDVRSFHGLASFYICFVKDFSTLAAPLNEMVKNNAGFKALKDRLTHSPILALPNFTKPFKLECNVSNMGVVVMLLQEVLCSSWGFISVATLFVVQGVCHPYEEGCASYLRKVLGFLSSQIDGLSHGLYTPSSSYFPLVGHFHGFCPKVA
ncbi:Retrovirus-related Pol polyprotein from transposon gypsy, partial [Mucuna pruriens]